MLRSPGVQTAPARSPLDVWSQQLGEPRAPVEGHRPSPFPLVRCLAGISFSRSTDLEPGVMRGTVEASEQGEFQDTCRVFWSHCSTSEPTSTSLQRFRDFGKQRCTQDLTANRLALTYIFIVLRPKTRRYVSFFFRPLHVLCNGSRKSTAQSRERCRAYAAMGARPPEQAGPQPADSHAHWPPAAPAPGLSGEKLAWTLTSPSPGARGFAACLVRSRMSVPGAVT